MTDNHATWMRLPDEVVRACELVDLMLRHWVTSVSTLALLECWLERGLVVVNAPLLHIIQHGGGGGDDDSSSTSSTREWIPRVFASVARQLWHQSSSSWTLARLEWDVRGWDHRWDDPLIPLTYHEAWLTVATWIVDRCPHAFPALHLDFDGDNATNAVMMMCALVEFRRPEARWAAERCIAAGRPIVLPPLLSLQLVTTNLPPHARDVVHLFLQEPHPLHEDAILVRGGAPHLCSMAHSLVGYLLLALRLDTTPADMKPWLSGWSIACLDDVLTALEEANGDFCWWWPWRSWVITIFLLQWCCHESHPHIIPKLHGLLARCDTTVKRRVFRKKLQQHSIMSSSLLLSLLEDEDAA
jgi:hypothetical protein